MNIYISKKENEIHHAKRLADLFLAVWHQQIAIPAWKKFLDRILEFYKIDVYFIFPDEYQMYGLKVSPAQKETGDYTHLAITYLNMKDGRVKMIFDLNALYHYYGRLTMDYFTLNTFAIIFSHELVHHQIIMDNTISKLGLPEHDIKAKMHQILDKYQAGEYPYQNVYKTFIFHKVKVQVYDYELFKNMCFNIIKVENKHESS